MTHFIGWARSTRVFGLALGLAGAAPPVGVGPASAAPDRLTREVAPVAQRVALRLDPREPGYSGTTTITIEAIRPFSEVRLHAEGLTVEAVNLAGGTVHLAAKWVSEGDAHVLVTFPERVPSGLYQLTIRFLNEFDTHATSL
jgi:alanyl aminopeptidase